MNYSVEARSEEVEKERALEKGQTNQVEYSQLEVK
jgi:hypothetical protein